MNDEPKTLVMCRKKGDKMLLQIDDHIILDLLVVDIRPGEVKLSFRVSDRIKISAIQKLLKGEVKWQINQT